MTTVNYYQSFDYVMRQIKKSGSNDCDSCRLYVSDRLWGIFATIRALYGRLGVLYNMSFERGAYLDWRKDNGFAQHAIALLGKPLYDQAKDTPLHGLEIVLGRADAEFLREARLMHKN